MQKVLQKNSWPGFPKKIKLRSSSMQFITKIFIQMKKELKKAQAEMYVEKCLLFGCKHRKQTRHPTDEQRFKKS